MFTVYMSMGMLAEPVRLKCFNAVFLMFSFYMSLGLLAEPSQAKKVQRSFLNVHRLHEFGYVC